MPTLIHLPLAPSQHTFVLNTGYSVWGISWTRDNDRHYLAVSGHKDRYETHVIGEPQYDDLENSIQIWDLNDLGRVDLPLVPLMTLVHDFGCVYDVKWMPGLQPMTSRLGVLAVACGDGSVRLFCVPRLEQSSSGPLFGNFVLPFVVSLCDSS